MPELVQRALAFSKEVGDVMERHHPESTPSTPQASVAAAMFMLALDHRDAILLLIMHGVRSSAATLVRPAHEAYCRGFWALRVATDQQIAALSGDRPRLPTLETILKQLRDVPSTAAIGKYQAWRATNDYVHGGSLHLSRMLSASEVGPQYPDHEAVEILEAADLCGLLACIGLNAACGLEPKELLSKLQELTLKRVSRRVVAAYRGGKA